MSALTRRRFAGSLALAALAPLLPSCVVREDSGVVRLRVAMWGSVAQQKLEQAIVREFERTHPGIVVDLLVIGFDRYEEKLNSMFAGDIAPDLMLVSLAQYDNWATRGALLDLSADQQALTRDLTMLPGPIAAFAREGQFFALPVNAHGFVSFVNLDAFAAAGIPVPDTGFTWEEILAFGPRLSRRAGATDVPTDFAVVPPFYSYPLLVGLGGRLFDDLYHPTRVLIVSAAGAAWIEQLRTLESSPFAASRSVVTDSGTYQLFRDGRTALYFAGRWQVPDFTGTTKFRWDVRPFPAGPQGRVTWSGGTGIGVSSSTRHVEEARRFARFYAGPVGARLAMRGGRTVPVYRELAQSEDFLALRPPDSPQHFVATMERGAASLALYAPGSQDVWDIVNRHIEEAFAAPARPAIEVTQRMGVDLERWLERQRRLGKLPTR